MTSVVPPPMSISEDAELLLVVEQNGLGRGEGLEHDVRTSRPARFSARTTFWTDGDRPGDDVHLDLEAHARHADGLIDAVLVVDDEVPAGARG